MELKEIREQQGMTQLQLSSEIGKDRSLIAKIESGDTFPSVETAKAIGKVLNVDWTIFFNKVGESNSLIIKKEDE